MVSRTVAKEGETLPGPVQSEGIRVRGSALLFQKDRFSSDERLDGDDEFKIILERESVRQRPSRQIYTDVALRALQQVYAATHPAAFLEKEKAPPLPGAETPWPGYPTVADLVTALDHEADEDREDQ